MKHSWRSVSEAPRALGLLLAVSLASRDVPGLYLQRQLPQGLLRQVIAEVVEERDDVFVALQLIMPEMRRGDSLLRKPNSPYGDDSIV